MDLLRSCTSIKNGNGSRKRSKILQLAEKDPDKKDKFVGNAARRKRLQNVLILGGKYKKGKTVYEPKIIGKIIRERRRKLFGSYC